MTKTTRTLLIGAALTGLFAGTTALAQDTGGNKSAKETSGKKAGKFHKEKHACKGQNSCKGKGGGDAANKGKNECKGKGGCRTDGKAQTTNQ